jgi:hypothetical protein
MQKEEPQLSIYSFSRVENTYFFDTINEVRYEVLFRSSPYIFGDDRVFAPFTYELIIKVAHNRSGFKRPPFDKLVAVTIAAIFTDFYETSLTTVCIYICDSSDGRQEIRQAKFSRWFEHFEKMDFIKIDDSIKEPDGVGYPVSLILKKKNPHLLAITEAFFELTTRYSDK